MQAQGLSNAPLVWMDHIKMVLSPPLSVPPLGSQYSQSYLQSSPNLPLLQRLSPPNLDNQCPCISERRLGTHPFPFLMPVTVNPFMNPSCINIAFHRLSRLISSSVCLVNSYSSGSTLFTQRFCEGFFDLFPLPGQRVCQLLYNGLCPLF